MEKLMYKIKNVLIPIIIILVMAAMYFTLESGH
jgi:hypothetical protein